MDPIGIYNGQGTLVIDTETQADCQFECIQRPDSSLTCRCHIEHFEDSAHQNRLLNAAGQMSQAQRLSGQSTGGASIEAEALFCTGAEVSPDKTLTLWFVAQSLRARFTSDRSSTAALRFGLTNLEFEGTHTDDTGPYIPLSPAGHKVTLRPLDDYQDRKRTLWATKDTLVTGEAEVEIHTSSEYDTIDAVLNDLTLLLSLARGCRVRWVYRDLIAPGGVHVERYHRRTPAKPYSSLALIPIHPPADIRDFVAQTFERLRDHKSTWDLHKAIPLYLEAKLDDDYLVMKGLKVVVLMEYLKGAYLRSHATEQPDEAPILKTLRQALHIESEPPFQDTLRTMCQTLRLPVNDGEIAGFTASRRALMSRARFADPENARREYNAMIHLASRVLLAILGYAGHYNDWTLPVDEMRVPFATEPPT